MPERPHVAVVALQGDFQKHIDKLNRLGANAYPARLPEDIERADAVIIPGGESTTIGKLMARFGLDLAIQRAAEQDKPIYGTCAGLILLSRRISDETAERGGQQTLGLLDATVARNAFGRQVDSFESALDVPVLGPEPLPAVFIRAPVIVETGPSVEVLASHDGRAVFVRQRFLLGSAFHPELTDDDRAHKLFLAMIHK
jgi:5'-phosphate synthase pdxT subunit